MIADRRDPIVVISTCWKWLSQARTGHSRITAMNRKMASTLAAATFALAVVSSAAWSAQAQDARSATAESNSADTLFVATSFWATFWPYFAGVVLLLLGVTRILRSGVMRSPGSERLLAFGPLLLAAPMGVFGTEHFVFTSVIAGMVPSWLPVHLFWTYLTGTALIAAAVSIVVKKHAGLAAALLGVMLLCFVLMIWVPSIAELPGNRFVLAVLLRDLSFSGAAFALALTLGFGPLARNSRIVLGSLRFSIAVPAIVFGIEHFLHPRFVPAVPLEHVMPAWVPAPVAFAYAVGAILIACGLCISFDWRGASAAAILGWMVVTLVGMVYVPMLVAEPSVGVGLNYLMDTLAFGGGALVWARALEPSVRFLNAARS